MTPASRSEVPTPGRRVRSGRHAGRGIDHVNVDWPALSSSDPIRWRPRADPVQKQDPGERDPRKWKKGLTHQGPLQKPAWSVAKCGAESPQTKTRIALRSIR